MLPRLARHGVELHLAEGHGVDQVEVEERRAGKTSFFSCSLMVESLPRSFLVDGLVEALLGAERSALQPLCLPGERLRWLSLEWLSALPGYVFPQYLGST